MPPGSHRVIGRPSELAVLDRVLSDVAADGSRAIALAGEPGIGKTHPLRELRERAGRAGFAVVACRASEFERDMPFELVADAIAPRSCAGSACGSTARPAVDPRERHVSSVFVKLGVASRAAVAAAIAREPAM